MRFAFAAIAWVCPLLLACSPSNQSNVMNVDENLTTTDIPSANDALPSVPVAPNPTHLYEFNDGDKYGYVAAVSEEDQKRGKAAGDVVLFVYRGHDGNTYKIDSVNPSGAVQVDYECKRPCAVLKEYTYRGVEYIGFTPDSLIGAAFTDAFNGFLVPAPLPEPQPSTSVASSDQSTDDSGQSNSGSDQQPNPTEWNPPASDPVVNSGA